MNKKNFRIHADPSTSSPESIPIQRSTYAEIAERSKQLKEVLTERKIRLHRDSALGKLLRDAEGLAKDWEEGKNNGGNRRLVNAAYANRIAAAVLEVRFDEGAQQCLVRIAGNDMDLSARTPSMGKDHLWELDLLSSLRRHGLASRLVDPPDIVLKLGGTDYPVACKKIYSEKGVQAQTKKGIKQLMAHGHGGIVAINIDDLVPEDNYLRSHSHMAASNFLSKFNQDFIERHRFVFQKYVAEGRCDGILISTLVVAEIESSKPQVNMITEATVWTLEGASRDTQARFSELRKALMANPGLS